MRIDLNSDVGESYGAWTMGQDDALMPLITSANVACGAHAGDPRRDGADGRHWLWSTGSSIGAHPGYPDRDGFGRRDLDMTDAELEASLLYQLGALAAFVRAAGATMTHVKPHGALYNRAAGDERLASVICRAVAVFDSSLVVVALAGSRMLAVAQCRAWRPPQRHSPIARTSRTEVSDRAGWPVPCCRHRGLPRRRRLPSRLKAG